AHGDPRRGLERLVAAQLTGFELLAHGKLDLALSGHADRLQEPPDRNVEGVFVHGVPPQRAEGPIMRHRPHRGPTAFTSTNSSLSASTPIPTCGSGGNGE